MGNGITYSQEIGEYQGGKDHFFIEKTYSFTKEEEILAQETFTLGFYTESVFQKMLADVGLRPLGMTETGEFFLFEKAA
ncbi:MAG: hypothetical protein ACFB9N_16120 [Geitlerinemataceae cyanobacterium]